MNPRLTPHRHAEPVAPQHPRARALRITSVGCFVFFLVGAGAIGLAAHDYRAALIGVGLLCLPFPITALGASSGGLLARGGRITPGERRFMILGVTLTALFGIGAEGLNATSSRQTSAVAYVSLGLAVITGLVGLTVLVNTRPIIGSQNVSSDG